LSAGKGDVPRPLQRSYLGLVSADAPEAATAQVHLLCTGASSGRLASTVGFIRDGDIKVIIDPGMVADREHILAPLAELGELAGAVTDVVFSHPDPSHTLHAALFPNARYHDRQASYHRDQRLARRSDGLLISPAIRLIETPSPTGTQLTTLAATAHGVVVFTHLWSSATEPLDGPHPAARSSLQAARRRVLAIATRIMPGHGPSFRPGPDTPV
jgi:glyoxylase-like metal-dependent hydrolase (beta-lactamase superfamily II)